MDIIKLLIIFLGIIVVIKYNKPLHIGLIVGIILTILVYRIGINDSVRLILIGSFSRDTIYLILAFYSITFLQRMLEKRKRIMLAEVSLDNLFNSVRSGDTVIIESISRLGRKTLDILSTFAPGVMQISSVIWLVRLQDGRFLLFI